MLQGRRGLLALLIQGSPLSPIIWQVDREDYGQVTFRNLNLDGLTFRLHKQYSLPLSLGTGMNGKIGILSSLNDLFYHFNEGAQGQGPPSLPFSKSCRSMKASKILMPDPT